VNETIVVSLNNESAVEEAFAKFGNDIACVIIEPVPANNGLLLQRKEFMQFLRAICTKYGAMLLFDEVISGFRVGFTGAAGFYAIKPDIITYGKIIGGGLPVGAYGASAQIMSSISPEGNVYQAGTLSGNPVAMAAGIAQLKLCLADGYYEQLDHKCRVLVDGIQSHCDSKKYKVTLHRIGSIFWMAFSDSPAIRSAEEIDSESMKHFRSMYHDLLENGIYLGPSGYEVGFVSAAHTDEDIAATVGKFNSCLDRMFL